LVSEGSTQSTIKLPVVLPEGTLADSAFVEVSFDPDGLAGIEDSLRGLIQYPYGCLEQTTSRLIPLVAVKELTQATGLAELQGEKLEHYIEIAIAKIFRHQTSNGGFGLWPGSEPEAYLTAYALWGLTLAKDAGYSIDENATERGVQYLRQELTREAPVDHGHTMMGEFSSRAFALYVLNVMKRPENAHATALLEKADGMPAYGQAFLARALAGVVGSAHASVSGLLSRWKETPGSRPGGSLIAEDRNAELYWYFSSNVRTSAVVLDTLIALRPADPRIPRLVKGLLDERRNEGSWDTTQEQLYALVALTHYAKARAGASAVVDASREGETLLHDTLSGEGISRVRHLTFPVRLGDARPLSIAASTGTVHYRALLRFRRDQAHQPADQHGMELTRSYLDPETGKPLSQIKEGQMVRVHLELGSIQTRTRVALSDYLPAGLEPINTRFVTAPSTVSEENEDWRTRLWVSHRELGEERVDAFMEWMSQRNGSFEYLARATTVGTFVAPAAHAGQMYDPEVRTRTALERVEIVPRP
jgi:alpha-2-macroglobulin